MRTAIVGCWILVLTCSFALGQTYKVIWSFSGPPHDGGFPVSNLVADGDGNLYGTTPYGGTSTASPCSVGAHCGSVFELSPNADGTWSEMVLYSFCSNYTNGLCFDGETPMAGLVLDSVGNLYGTTEYGGASTCGTRCGTVFELSPPAFPGGAWTESVLYNFCVGGGSCPDGGAPVSQLIFDESGNLYGTTSVGGTGAVPNGTVFELSLNADHWTETILYSFCISGHNSICPDGSLPQAGVMFDTEGNLYGTTESGGTRNSQGAGTVYELSPGPKGWMETVLVAFQPQGRIGVPLGAVSFDRNGNL
jgi:uncharacterized repeat protein (TIGR03803 family)